MSIYLFGGSFNPFHNGHRSLVQFILEADSGCSVIIIPAGQSPMKSAGALVTEEHRIQVIRRSLCDLQGWSIDRLELDRKGPSYTVDTLRELKRRNRWEEKPHLVIGDDWIEKFHRWKEVEAIQEMVHIALFHRQWREEKDFPYPHRYLNNPLVQVSSTEIRDKLRQNKSVDTLVHPEAAEYMEKNGLYKS